MKQIGCLLPRHSKTAQVILTNFNESKRSKRLNRSFESKQHRFRRLQRNLLFENYVHEGRESGCAWPEWRVAISRVDGSQRLIARGEFTCCARETFLCEFSAWQELGNSRRGCARRANH